MRWKLLLAYAGTNYCGWQRQVGALSVQERIEEALFQLTQKRCPLTASGRTDAGVHALEQVVHYDLQEAIDLSALNALLFPTIQANALFPVASTFHARYSAKRKVYHYHIALGDKPSPFFAPYRTHLRFPLNRTLIRAALPYLLGKQDFSAFRAVGCSSKSPIKTLYRAEMHEEEEALRLEFEGDGFLYKMVRNIVGTLIEVGVGKRSPCSLKPLITSKERKRAGATASAQGLFLAKVRY